MALQNHRVAVLNSPAELEIFLREEAGAAQLGGDTQSFVFQYSAAGLTLIIDGSTDGGKTFNAFQRTYTTPTPANITSITNLVLELNTAARWDGGVLPTEFTISNTGNQLVISSTIVGEGAALRINEESTVVGATANQDLLFDLNQVGRGTKGSVGLNGFVQAFADNNGKYVVVYTVS